MTTTITFAKLGNGDWGLRGPSAQLIPMATVTVSKKSGETKQLKVGTVLWTRDGQSMATIASAPSHTRVDSAGHRIGTGASYRAGVTSPHGRACPNCGSRECSAAWSRNSLCDED